MNPRLLKRFLPLLALLLTACSEQPRANVTGQMGERVEIGPLTYVVVESGWRSQLGEGFEVRTPQNRFLMLTISVTNGGGSELSVPMLTLESANKKEFRELSDGAGVENWMGVLRNIEPAQTLQGRILFDVPLGDYRLRLPDGGESGYEKYAWVEIPLRIDSDSVQAPLTADESK